MLVNKKNNIGKVKIVLHIWLHHTTITVVDYFPIPACTCVLFLIIRLNLCDLWTVFVLLADGHKASELLMSNGKLIIQCKSQHKTHAVISDCGVHIVENLGKILLE